MVSTKNYNKLPDRDSLKRICKAISVLDAIISPEWQYPYYSYNSNWAHDEECLQVLSGPGEMHILFRQDGCAIAGIVHEYEQPDKAQITKNLPFIFNEFIFGEPVTSIGLTFCIWTDETGQWQVGDLKNYEDGSEDMLGIFDGNPQTYVDNATDYFEESYKAGGIPVLTVTKIYNGQLLTKEMVLSIVDDVEDWGKLKADLMEIDYPISF